MPAIFHRIGINGTQQAVYDALTSRDGLGSWWNRPDQPGDRVGAVIKFVFHPSPEGSPVFRVEALKSCEHVRWSCLGGHEVWIGSVIDYRIGSADGETTLVLRHTYQGAESEFMAFCSVKWAYFLMSLKSLVEEGRGTPFPHDRKLSVWG
jgi:Activator of Hsp90 ATPase homolog 1-like protein